MICTPHFERTGQKVAAYCEIAGTPMCPLCIAGRPVMPFEEIVLPESARDLVRSTHYRRDAGLDNLYPVVRRKAHARG